MFKSDKMLILERKCEPTNQAVISESKSQSKWYLATQKCNNNVTISKAFLGARIVAQGGTLS